MYVSYRAKHRVPVNLTAFRNDGLICQYICFLKHYEASVNFSVVSQRSISHVKASRMFDYMLKLAESSILDPYSK